MSKEEKKENPRRDNLNTRKWMFAYEVSRVYAKTVKEEKVDEKGKKFTIEKEEDVDEIVEVYLKRPTRRLYDECNLFYSVKVSEGIKEGLLTRAMLSKRYRDDKGALSDEEKEELMNSLEDAATELQKKSDDIDISKIKEKYNS